MHLRRKLELRSRTLLAWACTCVAASLAPVSGGAARDTLDWDPSSEAIVRFSSAPWSLISPNRDFEAGCVVGFMAFHFSPTGYFVFNNRIRGSWRIDEIGNLQLRTREGLRFTLVVGDANLRASQNLPFLRRSFLFQQCPR